MAVGLKSRATAEEMRVSSPSQPEAISKPKVRLRFLDGYRGIMILSVALYHGLYDLVYMFGISMPWYSSPAADAWQEIMCCSFILIAGLSNSFTRKPFFRALKLLGCAAVLTLVTWVAMPDYIVVFGILHCLGVMSLVTIPVSRLLKRASGGRLVLLTVIFALVFLLTFSLYRGKIGGFGMYLHLPSVLYESSWLFWLGFPSPAFSSSDYFPLIPYGFLYLAGCSLGALGSKEGFPRWMYTFSFGRVLEWLGKNSLWIYMAHQPIIYGVLWLFFR